MSKGLFFIKSLGQSLLVVFILIFSLYAIYLLDTYKSDSQESIVVSEIKLQANNSYRMINKITFCKADTLDDLQNCSSEKFYDKIIDGYSCNSSGVLTYHDETEDSFIIPGFKCTVSSYQYGTK